MVEKTMILVDDRDKEKVSDHQWTCVQGVWVTVVDGFVLTPVDLIWKTRARSEHLNGDTSDFRRANVRLYREDGKLVGITFSHSHNLWLAKAQVDGITMSFGASKNPEIANAKWVEARPDAVASVRGPRKVARVGREFPSFEEYKPVRNRSKGGADDLIDD